jgi:hypothetical protein
VETQLQSVNIILYHIISSGEIMPNIMLWWLGYLLFTFVVQLEGNFCMAFRSLLEHTQG